MPRQNKEVTRVQIEQATIKLFGKRGYRDISMDEIAKKAGISKRTLYKYYPSKIALFISIFEQYLQRLISDHIAIDYHTMNFSETLLATFASVYDFTDRNQGFMKLFWMLNNDTVEGEIPEELLRHVLLLNSKIMENSARILAEKKPTGIFRDVSTTLITQVCSAMNKGLFMQVEKEAGIGLNSVTQQDLYETCCNMLAHCAKD